MIRKTLKNMLVGILVVSMMVPTGIFAAVEEQGAALNTQEDNIGTNNGKIIDGQESEEIPTDDEEDLSEGTQEEVKEDGQGELSEEQEETPQLNRAQSSKIIISPTITPTVSSPASLSQLKGEWRSQGGRFWYRYNDGTYPKSVLITIDNQTYYFDSAGWMVTGWKQIEKKWFYFNPKKADGALGIMLTGWRTIDKKVYYLKKTGALKVKGKMLTGWQTIGDKVYRFDSSGALNMGWKQLSGKWYYFKKTGNPGTKGKMLTGWQTIGGQAYYLKKTGAYGAKGKMLTGWQTINKKIYRFDSSGAMNTGWKKLNGKWYYFKKTGNPGTKGKMLTGWQTLGGKRYYLKKTGAYGTIGYMFTGTHIIDGKTYYFDSSGAYTPTEGYVYATDPTDKTSRKVEPQFYTDPQIGKDVTEDEFFAAVLYTEAGDQKLEGQIMVALTILNRVESSQFPNSLKFVIYSDQQFEVARNGTLTTWLQRIRDKDPKVSYLTTYKSKEAVKEARKTFNAYKKSGTPRSISGITLPNNKKDFDYLFFMTHSSFDKLNLDAKACDVYKYRDHTFFKKWVKK